MRRRKTKGRKEVLMNVPKTLKEKVEAEVKVNDVPELFSSPVSRNAMTWTILSHPGYTTDRLRCVTE